MRGVARELAMTIPPAAIQNGAVINGVATDPVTYLLYVLTNKFEALEDMEVDSEEGNQALEMVFMRQV